MGAVITKGMSCPARLSILNCSGAVGDYWFMSLRSGWLSAGSAVRMRLVVGIGLILMRWSLDRVVLVHPGGGFPFQFDATGEGRMLVD
ncbi:hypothetical protein A3216_08175 [Mycobacterium leprae 7935681]|nr:hypothetical protein A3216_08175 [Mycobacterium leprae 7935681]